MHWWCTLVFKNGHLGWMDTQLLLIDTLFDYSIHTHLLRMGTCLILHTLKFDDSHSILDTVHTICFENAHHLFLCYFSKKRAQHSLVIWYTPYTSENEESKYSVNLIQGIPYMFTSTISYVPLLTTLNRYNSDQYNSLHKEIVSFYCVLIFYPLLWSRWGSYHSIGNNALSKYFCQG